MGTLTVLQFKNTPIRDDGALLNLTDMWRASGSPENRRPAEWARKEGAAFIEFIGESLNMASGHIIRTDRGRDGGTWAHWQIGLAYAKYLGHEFHAWCNEVVRAHMEGRGVPVQAGAMLATRATKEEITEYVDALVSAMAAQVLTPLAGSIDRVDLKVERVDGKVERLTGKLSEFTNETNARFDDLQRSLAGRRRDLALRTEREHVEAIHRMGGRCPCCHTTDVVKDKQRITGAEFDHYYGRSRNSVDDTWLICGTCHKALTHQTPRDGAYTRFKAYQECRRNLPNQQLKLAIG